MVLDTGGRGGLKIQIKSSDGLEIWPGFQRQSVNLPKLALWQLKLRELSEAIAQIYACRTYGRPSSFETHARKVIRPPKFMRGPSSPKRVPTIGRLDPQLVQQIIQPLPLKSGGDLRQEVTRLLVSAEVSHGCSYEHIINGE